MNGHRAEDEDREGFADDGVSGNPGVRKGGFKDPKLCIPNAGDILAAGGDADQAQARFAELAADLA